MAFYLNVLFFKSDDSTVLVFQFLILSWLTNGTEQDKTNAEKNLDKKKKKKKNGEFIKC